MLSVGETINPLNAPAIESQEHFAPARNREGGGALVSARASSKFPIAGNCVSWCSGESKPDIYFRETYGVFVSEPVLPGGGSVRKGSLNFRAISGQNSRSMFAPMSLAISIPTWRAAGAKPR